MTADGPVGQQSTAQPRLGRYARLRASMGRHPADVIRMAVAAAVVLACWLIAREHGVNPVESAIFSELERLPAGSAGFWHVMTWFGWWPGITVAAGLALYVGRVRMATSLAAAGATGWVLALVLHWLTAPRAVPTALAPVLRQPSSGGFDFPSLHVAVIAALVAAGGPYLARRTHHSSWILVVLVGVADVFLGRSLPVGAFAGAVLGWGVGTMYHLVLAAPGRRTSEQAVQMALDEAGLHHARIAAEGRGWLRPSVYSITTEAGDRLQMKVVRRMHRLAGPSYKVRRLLASVDVENEPGLSTPRHEVDHEAYITLLAERAGVGALPVVAAGEIEHGPPFLIRREVEGRRLSDLGSADVDDTLLDRIWRTVLTLGEHHLAHHDLRADNILVDVHGLPHITDFTFSRAGGPSGQVPQDIAEALVTLASVVGVRRAVDSAARAVPVELLRDALPHLQWLALHRRLRRQLDDGQATLADLRESLAERIDCPPPPFRSPVRPATLAVLAAIGLAVYLLLPQLSSIDEVLASLGHADWRWIAVTIATGFASIVVSAATILGASPRKLPVGKTIAVQLAAAFTGRTTAAGIGFFGINIIFLERIGLRRALAVGVLFLNRAVHGTVIGVSTAIGILIIGRAVPVGRISIPTGWPTILVAAVVVAAAIAVLASPFGRRRVWHPLKQQMRELARDLLPTLRKPVRAVQLLGGSIALLLLQAVGLVTTLAAFRPDFPVVPVLAVYVVGSAFGQLIPTPGGLGGVEAALVAGLTAVGIDATSAVTAVLASRVLTFWLPALPGLAAFRLLQHHQVV